MREDGTNSNPVGFEKYNNAESFREADRSFSSSSERTVTIPKRRSSTPEVLEELEKLSRSEPNRDINVVIGNKFHTGLDNQWDSQITIDGETHKSQSGVYNYDYAQNLAHEMEDVVGAQFVLSDKFASKSAIEQTPLKHIPFSEHIPKEVLTFFTHNFTRNLFIPRLSDSLSQTLRDKEADILLNKFQFSEGRNPNVEVLEWHRLKAESSGKDFNFELYDVREPKEGGGSTVRLQHSKYLAGKIDDKTVSFDYTAPSATLEVLGHKRGSSKTFFDLYYTSYHPEIYKEKREYHEELKQSNRDGDPTSYNGDYVIGGGNTILRRVIKDFKRAEGEVYIASPSFVMEEDSEQDSKLDTEAKDLM